MHPGLCSKQIQTLLISLYQKKDEIKAKVSHQIIIGTAL